MEPQLYPALRNSGFSAAETLPESPFICTQNNIVETSQISQFCQSSTATRNGLNPNTAESYSGCSESKRGGPAIAAARGGSSVTTPDPASNAMNEASLARLRKGTTTRAHFRRLYGLSVLDRKLCIETNWLNSEIEKLRLRIADLESELAASRQSSKRNIQVVLPSPSETPNTSTAASPCTHHQTRGRRRRQGRGWVGTYTTSPRSDQTSYYGTSSGFYFLHRIGAHLAEVLNQTLPKRHTYPQGVGATWKELTPLTMPSAGRAPALTAVLEPKMPRSQEEKFIHLFWQLYNCTIPIIDDVDFVQHYSSLWDASGTRRDQCPLTDIIVALSMQHGWSFLAFSMANSEALHDPSVAGRWYFHRCQSLLTADLESPSLVTVQCKMLSFIYLCNASFANTAHLMLGQATRMAHILGLHLEPAEGISCKVGELRKRVWCCLYTMEARVGLKLGRPSAIDNFYTTTTPPSEDVELGLLSSAHVHAPDITWITYAVRLQQLMDATANIHDSLQETLNAILDEKNLSGSLYEDPVAIELYAKAIAEQVPLMQAWVRQLPTGLQLQRRESGVPYSVDRSAISLPLEAPLWLQRQQISLELIYHSQMITLYRPCILFRRQSSANVYSPVTKQNAVMALKHAITYSNHMHQATLETDIMNGWQEFLTWQWNATITVVGFILSNPVDASTPTARKALDTGIAVFETFASSYMMAANALSAVRDLKNKILLLNNRFLDGIETVSSDFEVAKSGLGSPRGVASLPDVDTTCAYELEGSEFLDQFMDWALTVDSYNSLEQFLDTQN